MLQLAVASYTPLTSGQECRRQCISLMLLCLRYHYDRGCTWKSHDLVAVALKDTLKDGPALQILLRDWAIQVVTIVLPEDGVPIEDEIHSLPQRKSVLLLVLEQCPH